MNNYRVDRAMSATVPCGMNSILYIGDSWREARRVYAATAPGKDAWGQPNDAYGVLLSVWSDNLRWYDVKCSKGL